MTEGQQRELVALLRSPPPEDAGTAFEQLGRYLAPMDSGPHALDALRRVFGRADVSEGSPACRWWQWVGAYYFNPPRWRYWDALGIFAGLHEEMLKRQRQPGGQRLHKGLPLCWMSDCYYAMGLPWHARRFLVLTLCEDALTLGRDPSHYWRNSYWRLVMRDGVAHGDYHSCVREIGALFEQDSEPCAFPEWALRHLEHDRWLTRPRARHTGWLSVTPSVMEAGLYRPNASYIRHLRDRGSDASGRPMERLAAYLLGCMPGCRTRLRVHSYGAEYDVVCTMEGLQTDFRSELGRYFLCECKDKAKPANFPGVAKFCRVLQSVKARFGVIFSAEHLTGRDKRGCADGERLKLYHESGIVLVVVDEGDLGRLERGASFTEMLRDKYEQVRLDLHPETRRARSRRRTPAQP